MTLMDIKDLVSFSAVVTTILQFLSGILVCKQYVVKQTTAESSPLPFIGGFISCGVWLLYGLIKEDNIIILVNVVGILLMISYIIVFYIYTFKKSSVLRNFLLSIALFVFYMVYVSVETDNEILLSRVGLSACILTLMTIAAPMTKLLYVIRTKCTDCLPFPMILMSFVVSSLWFFYGLIEQDTYMTAPKVELLRCVMESWLTELIYFGWCFFCVIPNFIGGALSVVQLSLFMIYPANPYSSFPIKTTLA